MLEELLIYSDGGSRGNPGDAGIGIVISKTDGTILYEFKRYIGRKTNNQAEYTALIKALEMAKGYGAERVTCFMDSELVVKQLNGEYRVKNPTLKTMFQKVRALERGFEKVAYTYVPRENDKIQIADRLVNEAIDGR
ncbi:MAG: ribonuclease HI family protein [Candidatus Hydrothermarchaeales archaeon]